MENRNIRIRINLINREFEIDGDRDFVIENFGPQISDYLNDIKIGIKPIGNIPDAPNNDRNSNRIDVNKRSTDNDEIPSSFGEFYNRFPNGLSNVDKLLIAGYYLQITSGTKSFLVSQAAELLLDQNVKLSNPNAFNTANVSTKRVFKLSGREFKVSETGIDHIRTLGATN